MAEKVVRVRFIGDDSGAIRSSKKVEKSVKRVLTAQEKAAVKVAKLADKTAAAQIAAATRIQKALIASVTKIKVADARAAASIRKDAERTAQIKIRLADKAAARQIKVADKVAADEIRAIAKVQAAKVRFANQAARDAQRTAQVQIRATAMVEAARIRAATSAARAADRLAAAQVRTAKRAAAAQIREANRVAAAQKRAASQRASDIARVGASARKALVPLAAFVASFVTFIALRRGIDATVGAFSRLDQAFVGVSKTISGTPAQLREIRSELEDVARAGPVAATRLFELAQAAGQLGVARRDVVAFTRTMAQLEVTTDILGQEGAANFARFVGVASRGRPEFDRVAATLVGLGNTSRATEREILDLSTRFAAAGKNAGLAVPEILGLATAARSVGVRAESGGTAMQRFVNSISDAVKLGGKELKALANLTDLTGEAFQKAFSADTAGTLALVIEKMGELQKAGKSTTPFLEKLGLASQRTRTALDSMAASGTLVRDKMREATEEFRKNTAAAEEAAKFNKSFANQIKRTENNVELLGAALGRKLAPTLLKVNDQVLAMVGNTDEAAESVGRLTVAIGILVGAAVLGKFASVIGLASISLAGLAAVAIGPVGFVVAFAAVALVIKEIIDLYADLIAETGSVGGAMTALATEFGVFFGLMEHQVTPAMQGITVLTTRQAEQMRFLAEHLGTTTAKLRDFERGSATGFSALLQAARENPGGKIAEGFRVMREEMAAANRVIRETTQAMSDQSLVFANIIIKNVGGSSKSAADKVAFLTEQMKRFTSQGPKGAAAAAAIATEIQRIEKGSTKATEGLKKFSDAVNAALGRAGFISQSGADLQFRLLEEAIRIATDAAGEGSAAVRNLRGEVRQLIMQAQAAGAEINSSLGQQMAAAMKLANDQTIELIDTTEEFTTVSRVTAEGIVLDASRIKDGYVFVADEIRNAESAGIKFGQTLGTVLGQLIQGTISFGGALKTLATSLAGGLVDKLSGGLGSLLGGLASKIGLGGLASKLGLGGIAKSVSGLLGGALTGGISTALIAVAPFAIGKIGGFVKKIFGGKSLDERIAKLVKSKLGGSISKGLSQALAGLDIGISGAQFAGLGDIFGEIGSRSNVLHFVNQTIEAFDRIREGGRGTNEILATINNSLGIVIDAAQQTGQTGSEAFEQLIRVAQRSGVELDSLAKLKLPELQAATVATTDGMAQGFEDAARASTISMDAAMDEMENRGMAALSSIEESAGGVADSVAEAASSAADSVGRSADGAAGKLLNLQRFLDRFNLSKSGVEFQLDVDVPRSMPGREHGGSVRAGEEVIVGERRAEVFVPDTNGTIVPRVGDGDQAINMTIVIPGVAEFLVKGMTRSLREKITVVRASEIVPG